MQVKEAIETRKSVKRFMDKKPDWRKIIKAIDAVRFAPAAGNQFALKFILVKDKDKINKLANASQQDFVKQAHFVVVVVSDNSILKRSYPEKGEKYTRQQAGAAIENFLLALNDQNLATCWVGAFVDEQVKRILEIPETEDLVVEAFFPIGKETKAMTEGKGKLKPDLENILYFDKWKNKYMEPKTRVEIA
jgi:nitroreductase